MAKPLDLHHIHRRLHRPPIFSVGGRAMAIPEHEESSPGEPATSSTAEAAAASDAMGGASGPGGVDGDGGAEAKSVPSGEDPVLRLLTYPSVDQKADPGTEAADITAQI